MPMTKERRDELRAAFAALPNTHLEWGNNGRLFGPVCGKEPKDWVQVEGSFDPEPGDIDDPEAASYAKALCMVVNAFPELLDGVEEREKLRETVEAVREYLRPISASLYPSSAAARKALMIIDEHLGARP